MSLSNKDRWQNILIALATKYDFVAFLLTRFWRKRLLAKIATKRIQAGEITIPAMLLLGLKNKKLIDIKKYNLLNFKKNILLNRISPNYQLKKLTKNHQKSVLLVVHNSLPYDSAGYALRTMHEAKAYRELGYAVTIVTRQGYPWDLAKHRQLPYSESQIVEGVEIVTISGNRKYKVDSDIKYAIEYGRRVAELAIEKNVGFIQASSNYINGLACYIASRKSDIPFIYEARGMWHVTRASKEPKFSKTELYAYEDSIERWVLERASANFYITDLLRKSYLSKNQKKSAVVHNCIDQVESEIDYSGRNLTNDSFNLLYAGSLVFYEGLDLLLEVVASLEEFNISLSIYGDGPYQAEIMQKLNLLNAPNIHYYGKVDKSDMPSIYSCHHASISPRIASSVTSMIPPLKPLESISYGLPVITSDLPAVREILMGLDSILYADPSDSESLKKQIILMKENYSSYRNSIEKDILIVRDKSWKNSMNAAINNVV